MKDLTVIDMWSVK